MTVYEYVVIEAAEGKNASIIDEGKILAQEEDSARVIAARKIPAKVKSEDIEIVVRRFGSTRYEYGEEEE